MTDSSQIKWIDGTPASLIFDDIYFNTDNAIAECQYVFLEGNQLYQRFISWNRPDFNLGETGFGTGLNFLMASQLFISFRRSNPDHLLKKLNYYSVEKYPLSRHDFHEIQLKSGINQQFPDLSTYLINSWPLSRSILVNESIQLSILYDDASLFAEKLLGENILIDAWFFDGFSPSKNESMWSESLFSDLFKCSHSGATFSTFTASSKVRQNLTQAGFTVNKRKGFGKKREMLVGYK